MVAEIITQERAMLMISGLCIIGSNGPNTGTLRAAKNSSAAFF
jgi:hypothetical protein